MRLTSPELDAIRAATTEVLGPDAVVRLFGSRLDDSRRGGDIDLHFEVAGGRPDVAVAARLRDGMERRIGERAIDFVFRDPEAPLRPIDEVALREGVVL